MTAAEEGVLLLCSPLGDSGCRPLTMAQFRELGLRVRAGGLSGDPLSELGSAQLRQLGYDEAQAGRILRLLERRDRLLSYLARGERRGIFPLTRTSPDYPIRLSQKLRLSATPVLFCIGDPALLERPSVAVVGSRQLLPENEAFACSAGRRAAQEGLVLVSGNAPGADQAAQNACLDAGGSCIVFVADQLMDHAPHPRILYISEDAFDLPFSPARALHRNALIHIQGQRVIAVQCSYGSGGTWQGCLENLKRGWSPLFVFDDGSRGIHALMERGAVGIRAMTCIRDLRPMQTSFL